jgi:hypothetical protein
MELFYYNKFYVSNASARSRGGPVAVALGIEASNGRR